jgi:hypothetical protein
MVEMRVGVLARKRLDSMCVVKLAAKARPETTESGEWRIEMQKGASWRKVGI